MQEHTAELFSVRSAARILGFKSQDYIRKRLGNPDAIEKRKTGERFLYTMGHIQNLKHVLEDEKKQRCLMKGKVACYLCHERCEKCNLKSGICANCQAKKLVLNFSCRGDCTKCSPDCRMLDLLKKAVSDMEEKVKNNLSCKPGTGK